MDPGTWLVVASLGSGLGTLGLAVYVWPYRDKPGARWFLGALGWQTAWALGYGAALLAGEWPALRFVLEALTWVAMTGLATQFLAFALEYTGREAVVETSWFRTLLYSPVAVAAVALTNPLHRFLWTDFSLSPVAGAATVSYALRPWTLIGGVLGVLLVAAGTLLLFDTVVSYGPLYRREAVAVGLSPFPPMIAFLAWLFGVGPVPELNAAPLLFLPHVLLDAYAFAGSDMFDFHPATRRAGERAAIQDLGSPIVVVDERGRIASLNEAAERVFDVDETRALTRPLAAFVEGEFDPTDPDERVSISTGGTQRTYGVTATPLTGAGDAPVGHTLVFQDVTQELRREQRLAVLNRVLRHNLRNDMTVVRGYTITAAERVDDDAVADMLATVERKSEDLVALGEKARTIERVVASERDSRPVDLRELLASVTGTVAEAVPDAEVTIEGSAPTVVADRETLRVVCTELVENAVRHGGDEPSVTVRIEKTEDGGVAIRIDDEGSGIPDHELTVLDSGEETDLQHGTGLGLWLVDWGTRRLGADLSFEADETGTTASITLPADVVED